MAQTFSQLIRIHKNIAVHYEITVIPEESSLDKNKTLQWFKHDHWQETLQLLRPVVQARVIKRTSSLGCQSKPKVQESLTATIRGHGVVVVYNFIPSSMEPCLAPSGSNNMNNIKEKKHTISDCSQNLDTSYSRYDIYQEKLVAAVCLCADNQPVSNIKKEALMEKLNSYLEEHTQYVLGKRSSKLGKRSMKESAVYTTTESIRCHQDNINKPALVLTDRMPFKKSMEPPNLTKLKALSCCQLGNSHKCRSSAVKLSPSSAMAQENVAVSKKDFESKKRSGDPSQTAKAKRVKYSNVTSLSNQKCSVKALQKSKLSLKSTQYQTTNTSEDKQSEISAVSTESNEAQPIVSADLCNHLSSSLITSTESITCTVIGRNGKKSVTSPNHIRLVDKQLPINKSESSDYKCSYSDSQKSSSSDKLPSLTKYPCDSSISKPVQICPESNWLYKKPSPNTYSAKKSSSRQSYEVANAIIKNTPETHDIYDANINEEDHQREVTKLFDQLFAHSVANSSPKSEDSSKTITQSSGNQIVNSLDSSQESNSVVKTSKINKRRCSFVELFKEHSLASEASQTKSNTRKNDDVASPLKASEERMDHRDLSNDYNLMKEKFNSVRHIKDLAEETLIQWFNFNEYYLKGIYDRKIYCRRHEDYVKGGRTRLKLNYQVNLCLFSETQLDFIMDHLMQIFHEGNTENTDYLLKVLLPEVLIKIFMDVHNIGHNDSEKKMQTMMFAADTSQHAEFMR